MAYKENTIDFMDQVMRELEVCGGDLVYVGMWDYRGDCSNRKL